jgi:rubrerythrin
VRYQIFADKAELEGYTGIADLFRALGKSEQKQAEFLYRFIEEELNIDTMNEMETGNTVNLLKIAVADEVKDSKERYVQAARLAFEEDLAWVNQMLHSMAESESRHLEVLKLTLDDVLVIEKGKDKEKGYKVRDHLKKEDKDSDDEDDEDDDEDDEDEDDVSDYDFSDDDEEDEEEGKGVRTFSDFKKMQKKGASLKPSKKKK